MKKHLIPCFILSLSAVMTGRARAEDHKFKGIALDGSSTVMPISEAVAEEFTKANPKIRVTVGTSGTGGGFKKFIAEEIAIADASRPITDAELEQVKAKKIDFIELPIAYDALSVVVNKQNTFVDTITIADLKKIWEPGSTVKKWSDVNPKWPSEEIKLFGPGTDSGTFDYFTEHVNGKAKASRSDYTSSEDDNILVKGISGNKFALGYFGHAYYVANAKKINALKIDGGKGGVEPTDANILNKTYPLSRVLYIYVNKAALEHKEVEQFVEYYLNKVGALAHSTGYLGLSKEQYADAMKRFKQRLTGRDLSVAKKS